MKTKFEMDERVEILLSTRKKYGIILGFKRQFNYDDMYLVEDEDKKGSHCWILTDYLKKIHQKINVQNKKENIIL